MGRGTFPVLLAASWMTWWGAEMKQVAALTLYRIGGENLPAPTIATEALEVEVVRLTWDELPFTGSDAPVTLVQLPWAGVTENRFGGIELMKLTEDYAAPRRLEPEVNVVPVLEEMGGWLRVTAGDLNGAVFSQQDELEKMRDRDLNTAYFGTDGLAWGLGGTTWGACDSQWPSDSSQSERDPASDRPNIPGWPCRIKLYKIFNFNLGGPYNVKRVFFRTRPGRYEAEGHVKEFWVLTNVGDTNRGSYWIGMKAGTFRVDVAHHVAENVSGVIDLEISQSPVQYVLLAVEVGPEESPASKARWEVAEFEIYGDGYVPEARYTSNVIDLGGPASLGEVTWAGRKDEGARVDIRVRSGDDPDPNTYWMGVSGGTNGPGSTLTASPSTEIPTSFSKAEPAPGSVRTLTTGSSGPRRWISRPAAQTGWAPNPIDSCSLRPSSSRAGPMAGDGWTGCSSRSPSHPWPPR